MKNFKKHLLLVLASATFVACSSDDDSPVANNVTLSFTNTFGDREIVLGDAHSSSATGHTSAAGQYHHFAEVKYVISNIRLVKADGTEVPYHVNDLDKGAMVVNQANIESLTYVMNDIPSADYSQIKFGLGVRNDLNTLDQTRFPEFYAAAGANDTEMMWEWGTGYRFTKLEGFYDTDHKTMSIHTGSTVEGDESAYTQGVDAYRNIVLDLPEQARVGSQSPVIRIKADFDHLLSGRAHTITLSTGDGMDDNATPNIHTAVQMTKFVDNLGGDGVNDQQGMFSIISVQN